LLDNLRYHKLIKVSEGGGIDTLATDIPISAFNEFADRLEENIFLFGQGVNVKSDKFGNLSGVALKFMYGLLDLKSGIVERKFRTGLRRLIEFIAAYEEIARGKVYDPKKIDIVFNKSMILNELEMVQMAAQSKGIISDENIFGSNSPHVKIVDRQVVLDEKGNRAYTPLNGVRIITKDEGRDFSLGIKIGEFEIPSMPLKIDSIYLEKHFVKSYSIPNEFPIGSEIPLVLIGSAWKSTDVAEKNEMSKFCWGEFEGISPDFSQEQFKKMPHYIIFGIRVVEPR